MSASWATAWWACCTAACATTAPTTNTPPGHTGRPQLDVMKGRGLRSSWGSRRMLGVLTFHESREAPMDEYDGRQFVGIDLHRQRSVIVRQSESGEQLSAVRIVNDPVALKLQLEEAGADPEVVLEATYGWYWAVDVLQAGGARVHLAHPLGVKGFRYRRGKNDVRDAGDLARLLRVGRLPPAWIAPPEPRELRELVRCRAKLVAIRSGLKAQIHAVLAKAGVLIAVSDLFGVTGRQRLAKVPLGPAYAPLNRSLVELNGHI